MINEFDQIYRKDPSTRLFPLKSKC